LAYQPESRIDVESLVPSALEAYASSEELTVKTFSAQMSADGQEVLKRPAFLGSPGDNETDSNGGVSYLPVLFSALMPGTGEMYLGYKWRGAALITLEIAAWAGYFYYRNDGLDSREAYESYADEQWELQKWLNHHPDIYDPFNTTDATIEQLEQIGRDKSGSQEWPGYLPYVSKEDDKQHFYENIGKYDWYISGWRDFDPEQDDPWMKDTPLRTTYRDMRKESNDQLDTANSFIYLSLGVRVFSIIETVFLARSSGSANNDQDVSRNTLRLETRPLGIRGAEIALEYRFK
jgi:hypothetical protein